MADERFMRLLLTRLGKLGVEFARPKIVGARRGEPITVLQRALRAQPETDTRLDLVIPHYWAVYVHDGRNAPFSSRRFPFLIWYRDPKDDPRLVGGVTPERAAALRHLTTTEFDKALLDWRRARALGLQSPVIITRSVRKRTRGVFFFENYPGGGMRGFGLLAGTVGQREFRRFALSSMRETPRKTGALGFTTALPRLSRGGVDFGLILDVTAVRL